LHGGRDFPLLLAAGFALSEIDDAVMDLLHAQQPHIRGTHAGLLLAVSAAVRAELHARRNTMKLLAS